MVNGYIFGAPPEACDDLLPRHEYDPQQTKPPYSIDLNSFPRDGYIPGNIYRSKWFFKIKSPAFIQYLYIVILRGYFRGFMIQGRAIKNDNAAGSFGAGIEYRPQCIGNVSIALYRVRVYYVASCTAILFIECCNSYK